MTILRETAKNETFGGDLMPSVYVFWRSDGRLNFPEYCLLQELLSYPVVQTCFQNKTYPTPLNVRFSRNAVLHEVLMFDCLL